MDKNKKEEELPPVLQGSAAVAQMQIAIRYLHNIPNNVYEITMIHGGTCDYCGRVFVKLFHFRKKEDEGLEFEMCAPCIQFMGVDGILRVLKKNDNK